MKFVKSSISIFLAFVIIFCNLSPVSTANAYISFDEGGVFGKIVDFLGGAQLFDAIWGTDHSGDYASMQSQNYYTTPTESVEDKDGNVTNYYRSGDTTSTTIMDSYNHTFNTIHNVTTSNDYDANVALENFLNSYAVNTNNYTYNTEYKSWYYDATSNTYNYDASETYYNYDNSQYYISIDNSTDEYYLVNVQYSPTYVTVNYTYNNIDNSVHHGNVTNVYYYELTDGRNSATLTADDVLGLDLGYDVANFDLITDDSNTLSLQHFDYDYADSSTYNRNFYSVNRSTTYVDSGAFGQAVKLSSGSAAGVKIPGLFGYSGLTFDFRIYYDKISSFEVYLGDSRLFGAIPINVTKTFTDLFVDNGQIVDILAGKEDFLLDTIYQPTDYDFFTASSSQLANSHTRPSSYRDIVDSTWVADKYGYADVSVAPNMDSSKIEDFWKSDSKLYSSPYPDNYLWKFYHTHYKETTYSYSASNYLDVDFAYNSYANQWVSMRITIANGKIYYFVNGDLVGSGAFSIPRTADKFYIKSFGTLYLDELRITSGDMVYTSPYVPSTSPYDTNKVLALPSNMEENVIYARHSTPVTLWRVGGVRPSNPTKGFLYIPLYSDGTAGVSQIYDGSNWVNIETYIFDGNTAKSTKGFQFSMVGDSVDIDQSDSTPGGPGSGGSGSGGSGDSGDSGGSGSGSGDSDISLDWLGKLGTLIGSLVDGLLTLLDSTLGKVLDALITLVNSTIERLAKVIELFGTFGNAIGSIWGWLPEEIVLVLTAGVTIFVFLAVLRFFFK